MKIITITGISWSWKTTLQNELQRRGWAKPLNFTTRQPRNDWELDEYVFLTKEQFKEKRNLWHFLEHTEYRDNFYWISKFIDKDKDLAVVVEPNGREQIREFAEAHSLPFKAYFLELDRETQEQRLSRRGGNWKERLWDEELISPKEGDTILDWKASPEYLANLIETDD